MGSEKKISVIMPVYNTKEEFLREAIESILNQTFSDFEFIIVNDGSTNNAEEVILSARDMIISENAIRRKLGIYADMTIYSIPYPQIKKIAAIKDHIWGL